MIKVGVIGLGMMGRGHVAQYERIPNAGVVAVADADPKRLRGEAEAVGNIKLPSTMLDPSVQWFDDGFDLIAQAEVDLVDICVPTHRHAEYAICAAEAGRHVVTEKPMALNAAEAQRMIDSAHLSGVELMVAHCIRFWPEYRWLKEAVEDRRLGRLLHAEFSRSSAAPFWSWDNWMRDAECSGGAILDLHIHDVDFVNYLLGTPSRIYASGIRTPSTGGYDLVTALYSYDGGPEITLRCAWYSTPARRFYAGYLAVFEQGVVVYDSNAKPTLTLLRNESGEAEPLDVSGDAYFNELAFFVDTLTKGESPAAIISAESAKHSLELVELEIRSIETASPVHPE